MPHEPLETARQYLELSYLQLWIDQFALGGNLDVGQLAAYLRGERHVTKGAHNVVVHALNEVFVDRGDNHPLEYLAV